MARELKLIGVKHITHDCSVLKNNFLSSELAVFGQRRTLRGVFFQPYSGGKEFIFQAQHVIMPSLVVTALIINPIGASLSLAVLGALAGWAAVARLCVADKDKNQSFLYSVAGSFVNDFCQSMIDILVLPLTALLLVTRGGSTLLNTKEATMQKDVHPGLVPVM